MADTNIDAEVNNNGELVFESYNDQFVITRGVANFDTCFDYLPCYQGDRAGAGYIVGYSNGLLLCSNYIDYNRSKFYVCNPVTKQWTSIPTAPCPSLSLAPCIGFICDPNYHTDDHGDFILNSNCRFRILRAFGRSDPSDPEFDFLIFSSETGEWTSHKVRRDINDYWDRVNYSSRRMINYNGRFVVQVGQSIILYDPFSCEVIADIGPPKENIFTGTPRPRVTYEVKGGVWKQVDNDVEEEETTSSNKVVKILDGYSCSGGSLWACQLRNETRYETSTLYLWRLVEDDDNNDDDGGKKCYYWSLEKKQVGLPENLEHTTATLAKKCVKFGRVMTLDPDNPNMLYLNICYRGLIVLWNLETQTFTTVDTCDEGFFSWADAFLFQLPAS